MITSPQNGIRSVVVKKKYKLFLSWSSVEYKNDNTVYLHEPRFTGPVLKEAAKIEGDDSIKLDLSLQYIKTISSWEIATLSWGRVLSQTSAEVIFDYAIIKSDQLVKVKLLSDNDSIMIDCEKHEDEKHQYNLVYDAVVINSDNGPYENLRK